MSDKWLEDYESCKTYAQEINQQINNFKRLPNGSAQRGKSSATIRSMSSEFDKDVDKLSRELTNHLRNGIITTKEANRRRNLVDGINQMKEEIDRSIQEMYGGVASTSRVDPRFAPAVESEHTQGLTNEEFAGIRSTLKKNNDEAIEALHAAVKRQKEIGIAMNDEIERHNEIIDTITDRTQLLDSRVKRQTLLVRTVDRKSSAACLWCVAILLFIAIIVIVAVPFN